MAKASNNIASSYWVLLGEYFQHLLDEGLSSHSAEHRIHREFLHRQRRYRYRFADEDGPFRQGNLPDSFWSNVDFNLPKSLVTGSTPRSADSLMLAESTRQIAEHQTNFQNVQSWG
jgi:hypothetical protein